VRAVPPSQPSRADKPFAIVPCCVFPRAFPHRRLRLPPPDLGQLQPPPGAASDARGGAAAQRSGAEAGASEGTSVAVESYNQLVQYLVQRAVDADSGDSREAVRPGVVPGLRAGVICGGAGAAAGEQATCGARGAEGVAAWLQAHADAWSGQTVEIIEQSGDREKMWGGRQGAAGSGGGQGPPGSVMLSPRVGVCRLGFQGANLVVFRLP
jgi:hypothetical protein